jgi:hypothetical protein
LSTLRFLEADETVLSGRVIGIQRDLDALDITEFLEGVLELGSLNISRDLSDEYILVFNLCSVASKEILVERQSSARLALDFKVSHFLASGLEFIGVINLYHCRVEWLSDVSSDLRWHIELETGLILKHFSDLD